MPKENLMLHMDSIADARRAVIGKFWQKRGWLLRAILQAVLVLHSPYLLAFPHIRLSADLVEQENAVLEKVQFQLGREGEFRIDAARVALPGVEQDVKDVAISGVIEEFLSENGDLLLRCSLKADSIDANLELTTRGGDISAALRLLPQDIPALKRFEGMPPELDWVSNGRLEAVLFFMQQEDRPPVVTVQLGANGVGFDSPDGLFAAEALTVEAEISSPGNDWANLQIEGSILKGEVLLHDFYRNFSDGVLDFVLQPEWQDKQISLRSFSLTDGQALSVEGSAMFGLGDAAGEWDLEVSRLDLAFPGAYQGYMEAALATWTLDGLGVTGDLSWSGEWADGKFQDGDLEVSDLSIVDVQRGRFAVTGLDARLRPGDHQYDSVLTWRGLLLGAVNLGSGAVALDSEPGRFAIVEPLVLEVAGGLLKLGELKVLLPGAIGNDEAEPDIEVQAELLDLDMEQLTAALGWPSFAGKISGKIPGVSIEKGVLDIQGRILVNVFDGQLVAENLRIERPFGVLPSLAADIEAENLDLELLTSTFSFGRISGRIDGYMSDLRMLDWKPVAFDAWFGTPEDQRGSKGISRQAVNHLTTLGGGGATTALTSPLMRMFNNFSYKRLGLGCRMQNNVCEMRGVSEDGTSVLIMEGAGVPKITIRAFNRSVDWPQMLAQLMAVSEGEAIKVGD